ncbi:MAG: hypothetical protein QW561_03395, partial [Candidatus Aenigmatarchaeota archaeon]
GSLIIPDPSEGINAVRITDFEYDSDMDYNHRPQIIVRGDKVYIALQADGCIGGLILDHTKYSAGENAENPGDFIISEYTDFDCDGWNAHPRGAIDSSGNLHIVYDTDDYGNEMDVKYLKINPDGEIIVGPVRISTDETITERSRPSIAVDPSGNAHIVWTGDAWDDASAVWYAMVKSNATDTNYYAIPPTRISNDELVQSSVFASSDSEIEVILQSRDPYPGDRSWAPVVFIKLNPTLAPRDGSEVSPLTIITIPAMAVATSTQSYHVSGSYADGVINIFTYGFQWGDYFSGIDYIPVNTSGIPLQKGGPISSEDAATTYCCEWNKAYSVARGGVVYLVWTQYDPDSEIFLTSIKGAAVPAGGGGDDNCMISRTGPASWERMASFFLVWMIPFVFIVIYRIARRRA